MSNNDRATFFPPFPPDYRASGLLLHVTSLPSLYGIGDVGRDQRLLYVGISENLRKRLNSHASGRRGGDQFNIYVFDRLVLPVLSAEEFQKAAEGQISLDAKVRDYIRALAPIRGERPQAPRARVSTKSSRSLAFNPQHVENRGCPQFKQRRSQTWRRL